MYAVYVICVCYVFTYCCCLWSIQDEPFTSHLPEALFHMARYLFHLLNRENELPAGVSKALVKWQCMFLSYFTCTAVCQLNRRYGHQMSCIL